jgi:hypothetical protein
MVLPAMVIGAGHRRSIPPRGSARPLDRPIQRQPSARRLRV